MEKLYHGSSKEGIKRLEPMKSTHGTYVYATPDKELSIIFSGRCGDDLTYTLYKENENDPWIIVERIPKAFDTMFSNESSIYTVNDSFFKNIHTGFSEVVSEVGVDVLKEEKILNVYNSIKEMEKKGKVKLYIYPNRPDRIPNDDRDLIEKIINQCQRNNENITKNKFKRLLFLHPNMILLINEKLRELNLETFQKNDILDLLDEYIVMQMLDCNCEQYIKSSVIQILNYYPELTSEVQNRIDIFDKEKNEKINFIINSISKNFKNIPQDFVEATRKYYLNDDRSFIKICSELNIQLKKLNVMEELVNKNINQEVLDNSILLIGPMGTGKSTIANKLSESLSLPRISLDNKEQLKELYKQKESFENFKEFEFFLTCSTLTNLDKPCIVDFGAGHSVYESPLMFYEFKKLMNKFSNIIYMIPSKNKEESIQILNDRVMKRNPNELVQSLNNNRHFVEIPCNEELATLTEYTKGKDIQTITDEIINYVYEKSNDLTTTRHIV